MEISVLLLLTTMSCLYGVHPERSALKGVCKSPKHCACYEVPPTGIGYECRFFNVRKGDTFPALNGSKVEELTLNWHTPYQEPADVELSDGIFARMPNLKKLILIGAVRHNFTSNTFAGLDHLVDLQIMTLNSDTFFGKDWLRPLGGLQRLLLVGDHIQRFPSEHFCGLRYLNTLLMPNNEFDNIRDVGIGCNETLDNKLPCHSCLPNVTILDLSFSNISTLSFNFSKNVPQLRALILSHSGISNTTGIDSSVISSLQTLSLSDNKLSVFNIKDMEKCNESSLMVLDLHHNQLINISQGLFACTKHLVYLDLSGNNLSTKTLIEAGLNDLRRIQSMNLTGNNIISLEVGMIDGMIDLLRFSCGGCGMAWIDKDSLSNTTNLKILELQYNNLSFIHNSTLAHLINLTYLDLSHNKLIKFEVKVTLPSLKLLQLYGNHIQNLPDFSDLWPNLSSLYMSDNNITDFEPALLIGLKSLKYFYISFNKISYIPASPALLLPALTHIDLSNNVIRRIENFAFSSEHNITFVNLNNNFLDEFNIPEVFYSSVRYLLMHGNYLYEIGSKLPYMFSLEYLDVSKNNISVISEHVFSKLPHLTLVNLTFNNLRIMNARVLAASQGINPKLKIYLQGNPLHCDCDNVLLKKGNLALSSPDYYVQECNSRGVPVRESEVEFLKRYRRLPQIPDVDLLYCDVARSPDNHTLTSLAIEQFLCPYKNSLGSRNDCDIHCNCYYSGFDFMKIMDCSSMNLNTLPIIWQVGVKKIFLNDNAIEKVEKDIFSQSKFKELEKLYLQDNNITSIEKGNFENLTSLDTLLLHNNTLRMINLTIFKELPSLKYITLHDNPWECDCTFGPAFKAFVTINAAIIDKPSTIMCTYPNITDPALHILSSQEINLEFLSMPLLKNDFSFCQNTSDLQIIKHVTKHSIVGLVSIAAIFVCISCIGITLYKYRLILMVWVYNKFGARFHHEDEDNEAKPYDVFIAHAQEDERFVCENLLPGLEEGDLSYKVCLECRDWPVGDIHTETIIASVQQSKRTILLVSESYFESEWCRYEFLAAHYQVLKDKQLRLIIILLDIDMKSRVESDMKLYLKTGTYLVFGEKYFWPKLRYYLADDPRGKDDADGQFRLLDVHKDDAV